MTKQEIESKVMDIICEQLHTDREKVKRETKFVDDLNADSLDLAELTMEFEDVFDIEIPSEGEPPVTVGDVVDFVAKKVEEKA
ncbi:acyl carrier protein [Planctomycetales bacterium]|nr:acyl carrier protein [Planctomycetales bacterium]GHT03279.1 acyl carrier protein [Planctomycetales bacterium]